MAQGTQPLSDIFRNNVLFRWRAGQNVPRATYTRTSQAAYMQQTGIGTKAAASTLRVHWVDLDGDGYRETPTNLLEGARTQLVTDPENFGAWSLNGTPVLTSGQADPFGGTAAYLIGDDSAAAGEFILQTIGAFTGDGLKAMAVFVRPFTAGLTQRVKLFDAVAAADRMNVNITWSGGVPTPTVTVGTLLSTEGPYQNGFYRLGLQTTSVTAANGHNIRLLPTSSTVGDVGSHYFFGVNAWNVPFVSGYQGPSLGTAAADAYSIPFNWSPCDCTVLVQMARPTHADMSGTIGANPTIFEIGTSAARLMGNFDSASRLLVGQIDTATTDRSATAAIPTGTSLTTSWQFKNLTTGGQVAIDVGSGLSAFSAAATAFSAFGSQTLRIGGTTPDELYGGIINMLIVRGLKTRQEMMQLAGIL